MDAHDLDRYAGEIVNAGNCNAHTGGPHGRFRASAINDGSWWPPGASGRTIAPWRVRRRSGAPCAAPVGGPRGRAAGSVGLSGSCLRAI